jgi:hypothetical protein
MSNHSPSRYRREGRKAFYQWGDALAACPYKQWGRNDWLEGWGEGEREFNNGLADRERNIEIAVNTGIPCKPILFSVECYICGTGPCSGGPRV